MIKSAFAVMLWAAGACAAILFLLAAYAYCFLMWIKDEHQPRRKP